MNKKILRFIIGEKYPKWWTNFCSINNNYFWSTDYSYHEWLNKILKKYNSRIYATNKYVELIFNSEQDYILFLMKYS